MTSSKSSCRGGKDEQAIRRCVLATVSVEDDVVSVGD